MSEEANTKRNLILAAIQDLNDKDILENNNFTYWGKPGIVTQSHEGHPHGPPPDPPPGGGQ